MAIVFGEEKDKLIETLLFFEHVHGQDQPMPPNLTAPHEGVIQDGIQVLQDRIELEKGRCSGGGEEGGREVEWWGGEEEEKGIGRKGGEKGFGRRGNGWRREEKKGWGKMRWGKRD